MSSQTASRESEHQDQDEEITLRISYNGVVRELENVKATDAGAAVLQRALTLFANVERPHEERLYRKDSADELSSDQTVKQLGLKDEELLVLHPRSVQGG